MTLDTPFHPQDPVPQQVIQTWFFADLLPWQTQTWQYLTSHFPNLPHAMLFAGNAGTGKRAFVYRFVAWALCQHKTTNAQGIASACGHCDSCQWLIASTHPRLYQLPLPLASADGTQKSTKSTKSTANKLSNEAPTHQQSALIKIDDIRDLQPFVQQSSDGIRFVVIHQADAMTLGASNALLKALEEPANQVLMLLISDTSSQLLPTIRSRLQAFSVSQVSPETSLIFMQQQFADANVADLQQVNAMSGYAPFVALDMLQSQWYQHRQTWINTWQALRSFQRSPIQASDYWQKTLSLSDFLYLSQLMLTELGKTLIQLDSFGVQQDIEWQKLQPLPSLTALYQLQHTINEIWQDKRQHLQDKLCYDKLFSEMQRF